MQAPTRRQAQRGGGAGWGLSKASRVAPSGKPRQTASHMDVRDSRRRRDPAHEAQAFRQTILVKEEETRTIKTIGTGASKMAGTQRYDSARLQAFLSPCPIRLLRVGRV